MNLSSFPLSAQEFPRTHQVLNEALAEGVAPGFVAALWDARRPEQYRVAAWGKRRLIPSEQPMLEDTVFDLASVSKVFGTATLAAVLVERGWIGWETPVRAFLPEFLSGEIHLGHLLSHTSGLPWWKPLWQEMRAHFGDAPGLIRAGVAARQAEMRRRVLAIAPEVAPETQAVYSDISFLVLGYALEEATQMPLDRAVRELVWKPMGIRGAFYRKVNRGVEKGRLEHVAATESCPWRGGVLQGQVHDDNCWSMGGVAGHAGAFGRAEDVMTFAAGLMGGFLSRRTLERAWRRVPRPVDCSRTLGWDTPSGETPSASRKFSPRSVGHLGFTGTSLWMDPEAGMAVTLLSNRVHPTRENEKIRALRPRFHEAIRFDLGR